MFLFEFPTYNEAKVCSVSFATRSAARLGHRELVCCTVPAFFCDHVPRKCLPHTFSDRNPSRRSLVYSVAADFSCTKLNAKRATLEATDHANRDDSSPNPCTYVYPSCICIYLCICIYVYPSTIVIANTLTAEQLHAPLSALPENCTVFTVVHDGPNNFETIFLYKDLLIVACNAGRNGTIIFVRSRENCIFMVEIRKYVIIHECRYK